MGGSTDLIQPLSLWRTRDRFRSKRSGRANCCASSFPSSDPPSTGNMARYGRLIGALVLLGVTGLAGIGVGAAAEACSARYIKMIVANPPGGVGDLMARTVEGGASTEVK